MAKRDKSDLPRGIRRRGPDWHYRFVHRGVIHTGSTGLAATKTNLKEAVEILTLERAKVRGGARKLQSVAFSVAVSRFLAAVKPEYKPESHRRLSTSMAVLERFFELADVHAINAGDIDDYKAARRAQTPPVAEVTIRHDLHALSLLLQHARRHGWMEHDPLADVVMPSDKASVRERVVSPEEERLYFAEVGRYKHSALADVARLILLTGMRPNEVYRLEWRDVDIFNGVLFVRESKTEAGKRTLRLVGEARGILHERMEAAANDDTAPGQHSRRADRVSSLSRRDHPCVVPEGGRRQGLREDALGSGAPACRFVFPSPKRPGEPLSRLTVSHSAACARAGVDFQLRDLRRTFGTRMAAAGCPPHVLMRIMGHSSLKVTMRHYVHAQADEQAAAFDLYEKALEKGQGAVH